VAVLHLVNVLLPLTLLGLVLTPGLIVLKNLCGLFNELPGVCHRLVGKRYRIPRALDFFPVFPSYLRAADRRHARVSAVAVLRRERFIHGNTPLACGFPSGHLNQCHIRWVIFHG
jgi:hypothetical protein